MSDGKQIKVLIVDDMSKARDELEQRYVQAGFDVVGKAENGLDALEKIKELKPDLISLDIIMPVMDGIECFRRLTGRYQGAKEDTKFTRDDFKKLSPKVIFISCLAGEPKVVEAYQNEIPGYAFLEKYPSAEMLREHVNLVMNQQEANVEP